MDHTQQVGLLRRVFRMLDERSTELAEAPYRNPVSAYTSPERFSQERALLLHREPVLAGLSGDAAAPGDSFVREIGGVPILVVRAASGAAHAFVGLCRHRGAPIAGGAGRGDGRLRCPYHGWTYDEAGDLVGQPCPEGFAGLPAEDLCLKRLPVAERHGLIFVRPTPGPPVDPDAHLGGAAHELASFGLERWVPFARHVTRRALNWKLVVESFLEAYHVPALHQRTIAPAILGAPALWDAFGRSGRLVAVRRSIADLRTRPESEWDLLAHSVILYLLFPDTILIHQIDHVEVVQVDAHGPADTTVSFGLYTPEPAVTASARHHFQGNLDLLVRVSEQEDFQVGEDMQRGFHAPGSDRVVYGRNEPGVSHFHRAVNAALEGDLG
jgi:phenylpropionate dioxygenase-like ring-hydroxylating dioxygenase large terminal subunit